MFELCESGAFSIRHLYRHLPTNPRCRVCLVPFGGMGRILRISPSRKNPSFCTSCIDTAPEGVHDMEVGVLFADIRGFTAWSSAQTASEAAQRVTEFYDLASRVLMKDDALIEFVGDQVMAIYLPSFPSLRERVADTMLTAARRLVREVQLQGGSDPIRIGVGLNYGLASVGNIRKGGQKDFTAVGDVVNTASRLQAAAGPSEIIIADAAYQKLTTEPSGLEQRLLEVKGKPDALPVHVLPASLATASPEPDHHDDSDAAQGRNLRKRRAIALGVLAALVIVVVASLALRWPAPMLAALVGYAVYHRAAGGRG
jgi:adenylate cyclase